MSQSGKRVVMTGAARRTGTGFARAGLAEATQVALANINAAAVQAAAPSSGPHEISTDVTRRESIGCGVVVPFGCRGAAQRHSGTATFLATPVGGQIPAHGHGADGGNRIA